jgi:ABC-2 type transport system permease protein
VVAQILRLKLILVANAFRRTPGQVVGLGLGLLYGLGTAGFIANSLIALGFADVEVSRPAVIVFGSVTLIIFAVLPLVLGVDDVLDPRRFSLFGISNTTLAASIGIASLLSVPAIVIAIIAVAQTATWSRDPDAHALAIAAAVIIVITTVLTARISMSLAGLLLSTRRSRDISTLVGVVLLIALAPVIVVLASVDWAGNGVAVLTAIADVLGWTPLGAAWAAPADAAAGLGSDAVAKLAIAIIWVLVLCVAWRALVAVVLVAPARQPHAKKHLGLGWFDRVPRTPIGAIAARSITYWTRDSRYLSSLAIIPFVPVFMILALSIAGLSLQSLALLPVPVMCLFLSWLVHNDVSFDNSAIWLHLASSTSGRDDRWGRLLPVLGLGVPLVLVGSVISIAFFGDWTVLPSLIGVSSAILLAGLGLSSITSARFAYPAVRPGDSPFTQPQAGGNSAGLVQGLSFFGILLLASPAIAAAVLGFLYGASWHYLALGLGVGVGLIALVGGVRIGAAAYDARSSELLAAALKN